MKEFNVRFELELQECSSKEVAVELTKEWILDNIDNIEFVVTENERTVTELWETLGDIPIDSDETIEEKFLHFPVGTDREDIWHWFEDTFNCSVVDLMWLNK